MSLSRLGRIGFAAMAFTILDARAAERSCPAAGTLGIARTIAVGGAPRVGFKTYPRSLDLKDHEVVLTFDDGPSPRTTPRVLDALAAQCVKADFFLIGRNAAAAPGLVRREVEEGHTVGHHTWSHPAVTLRGLSETAAAADIDRGMAADDKAAYGSARGAPRVPFFRFPGFADTRPLLERLSARGIAVFSTDLWASDWDTMTPEAELERLMGRLRAAGRGIILLHDTKRETADMLPRFLEALRIGGYRVVRVVPGPGPTPIRAAPAGWASETEAILARLRPDAPQQGSHPVGPEGMPARRPASDPAALPEGASRPNGSDEPDLDLGLRHSDP